MTEQEKREKAIEEMARIACIDCVKEKRHDDSCLNHPYCVGTISAIRLYDAGYRKEEEVQKKKAREILQTLFNNLKYPQYFQVYIKTLAQENGVEVEE